MDMKTELNLEDMAHVSGGVQRIVNTGIEGLNAAVRAKAMKSSSQIGSLPNGTVIDTVSDELVYDPKEKRNFVQINYIDKNGKPATGWIAASIVGLPR